MNPDPEWAPTGIEFGECLEDATMASSPSKVSGKFVGVWFAYEGIRRRLVLVEVAAAKLNELTPEEFNAGVVRTSDLSVVSARFNDDELAEISRYLRHAAAAKNPGPEEAREGHRFNPPRSHAEVLYRTRFELPWPADVDAALLHRRADARAKNADRRTLVFAVGSLAVALVSVVISNKALRNTSVIPEGTADRAAAAQFIADTQVAFARRATSGRGGRATALTQSQRARVDAAYARYVVASRSNHAKSRASRIVRVLSDGASSSRQVMNERDDFVAAADR